jgi:hypothetical protein
MHQRIAAYPEGSRITDEVRRGRGIEQTWYRKRAVKT